MEQDKPVVIELKSDSDYILLVNPAHILGRTLKDALAPHRKEGRVITVAMVHDTEKAMRFVEVPHRVDKHNETLYDLVYDLDGEAVTGQMEKITEWLKNRFSIEIDLQEEYDRLRRLHR